jgi:hypothetical protein
VVGCFFLTGFLNSLASASAGWRTPRIQLLDLDGKVIPGATLPDLGHDFVGWAGGKLLPATWMTPEGAVAWEDGPDAFVEVYMALVLVLLVFHPQRFKIIRRVLAIFSLLNVLRSFTVIVTSLPDASPKCDRQWTDPLTGSYKRKPMWPSNLQRALLLGHTTCGDMIFSGHTTCLVLAVKTFGEHFRGNRLRGMAAFPEWLARIVRAALRAATAVGVTVILSTRLHYTLDVALAVYLTHTVFEYYHTVARMLPLRRGYPVVRWLEHDDVQATERRAYYGHGALRPLDDTTPRPRADSSDTPAGAGKGGKPVGLRRSVSGGEANRTKKRSYS